MDAIKGDLSKRLEEDPLALKQMKWHLANPYVSHKLGHYVIQDSEGNYYRIRKVPIQF